MILVLLAPLIATVLPSLLPASAARRVLRVLLAVAAAPLPLLVAAHIDRLSLLLALLVSALAALAIVFSTGNGIFASRSGEVLGEVDAAPGWSRVSVYFGLIGVFWSAMLLAVTADTFSGLWLGISATTLATAFLVALGGEPLALEAAWKYLVLCTLGIAFALLGITLLAHVAMDAGLGPTLRWDALAHAGRAPAPLARIAIGLMLVGFATKAGLVPMHAWLPDAHAKAPAPISALLSGALVSCALYALMRTLQAASGLGAALFARETLLWLGVVSILAAGVFMLAQRDLKRLFAYSTVEHAGLVAFALGLGTPLGDLAAVVHVLAHGVSKAAAFFAVGLVQRRLATTAIGELRGLWRLGAPGRLLLGAFAGLAGLPPFGLFASELLVVLAAVTAQRWSALALALVGLAFGFAALARAAIAIESGASPHRTLRPATDGLRFVSTAAAGLALAGAALALALPWTALAP